MLRLNRFNNLLLSICLISILGACGAKKKTVLRNSEPIKKEVTTKSGARNKATLVNYYADLLQVDPKQLNRDLYLTIDEWMGVSHRLGGMDKKGIDCSGFVSIVYQDIYNKKLPRISSAMADRIVRKYDDQLQEGDLVFFSFGGKGIDHVGIYLHNDRFVHVSTSRGVIISNLKDTWYYKYLTRCGTPVI